MKPEYWIGIMALVGAILGTIIGLIFSPDSGATFAGGGTIAGIATGTGVYAHLKQKEETR